MTSQTEDWVREAERLHAFLEENTKPLAPDEVPCHDHPTSLRALYQSSLIQLGQSGA